MCRAERLRAPDRNLSPEQARCRIHETSAGDAKSKKELRRVQDVPLRSACRASRRRPCSLGRHACRLCLPRSCCGRVRLRRDASAIPRDPLEARLHTPRREESDRGTRYEDHRRCCEHEDTAASLRQPRVGLLRPDPCGVLDGLRELSSGCYCPLPELGRDEDELRGDRLCRIDDR